MGEFPYQVSLQRYSDSKHFCAGVILTCDWILTAGDCVDDKRPPEVYALTGSINASIGTNYHIELAVLHPNYAALNASNNIALLRTATQIIFNEFTRAINISRRSIIKPGQLATISGWGLTTRADGTMSDSEVLQYMSYRTISIEECRQKMIKEDSTHAIYLSSLCALTTIKRGACAGDTGSPLTLKGSLIGVHLLSYGCGEDYPSVSIRVFTFKRWIRKMMAATYLRLPNSKCVCRTPLYCICKRIEE